jgi:carbamoyltransferase
MNILGLNLTSKNPAACLIQDGVLKSFVEEERFIGLKCATNQMPEKAVSYCLHEARISPDDLDGIAVGWDANKYKYEIPFFSAKLVLKNLLKMKFLNSGGQSGLLSILENMPAHRKYQIEIMLRHLGLRGECPTIRFFQHHMTHAASAYYCSGFTESVILTMDGSGENHCTDIFMGRSGEITLKESLEIPNSIGWFYTAITEFLGFEPYEGEYKVMGMAPYGKFNEKIMHKIEKIVRIENNTYEIDPSYLLLGKHTYGAYFSDELVHLFGINPRLNDEINEVHKDIAFCAQAKLEEVALNLVKTATKDGRIRQLCLAGGVALNCKMVGKILTSGYVDNIFVQPVSYDSGTALGAALLLAKEKGDHVSNEMKTVYYGPQYSNKHVENVLKISGLKFRSYEDPTDIVAQKITSGDIVGWFQGRMESGPRALGNRSILANPMNEEMRDKVNMAVKYREPWRPFTPSLLDEVKEQYLNYACYSPFMTITFPVAADKENVIPAVTHVDGSTRPQTVRQDVNPLYWKLIYKVGEQTGVPVVLNTSLNIKGKPMVCSPTHAIECFTTTGLDAMVINNYVITKK